MMEDVHRKRVSQTVSAEEGKLRPLLSVFAPEPFPKAAALVGKPRSFIFSRFELCCGYAQLVDTLSHLTSP